MALGGGSNGRHTVVKRGGEQWSNKVAEKSRTGRCSDHTGRRSGQTGWHTVVKQGCIAVKRGSLIAYRAYKYTPRVVAACVATVIVVKLGGRVVKRLPLTGAAV